ncbi:TonB-dependent receptor [Lysobacter silvisoli]|uniref:TonB-dependent receptor n=1 Tax=Lysobacter silvisoli TaxID=2293254 RepID=A0A371K005_9GAMM|nr:TonB-dependent receptor [Lysobacter silvisoli]RDZ27167.1 TonB-dependent receptor [Lysobacter silvisoli]
MSYPDRPFAAGAAALRPVIAAAPLTRALRLALFALTLAPAVAAAQTAGAQATDLDEVVVIAEREPGNFAIDRAEIDLTQAGDVADLLSNQSGVAVGGGAPVAQKIYVRGFEDTLLNVTIDNAPQPAELYHHQTRVQIEPEFVKSIELDAGAGAATAGPGALTGALRVTTRDAFDMLALYGDPQRDAGVLVKGAGGFNGENSYKAVVSAFGRWSDRFGAMATYVLQDGGDYDTGDGRRVTPTAYRHERGQARFTGHFGDHTADLSLEHLSDTGTYYERPHMINFAGRFILSDHEMTRETASYNHRYDPASEAVDVQATLFRTVSDYQNRRNTTGQLYGRGEQTSYGLDLRNTARWSALELVYGVDYRRDELDARQQAVPRPFWASTVQTVSVLGAYGQATWTPSEQWRVSAGARWDDYRHRVASGPGAGAANSQARFSPNASIQWQPTEHLTLRAAYADAFRGVTIREAFFSALYVHHGDLEGESADNAEIGVAWERDGWFARATGFRQHIDDYINAVYTGDVGAEWGRWANVGRAEVEGYEAEAGRRWDAYELALGVWNSDTRFNDRPLNDADLGLGTSIGRTWTARFDWRASPRARYGLRARHVEAEDNNITPTAPPKPGYTVADVMGEWSLDAARRLKLGAAVSNLFDRSYYDHGTYGYHSSGTYIGFPAQGRELRVSLSYLF